MIVHQGLSRGIYQYVIAKNDLYKTLGHSVDLCHFDKILKLNV